MSNKVSREAYRDYLRSSRGSSSLCQDNPKSKIRQQAIREIRAIQNINPEMLFRGYFGVCVEIRGKCRADGDNVQKAVSDALKGIAFTDDSPKYQRQGSFRFIG